MMYSKKFKLILGLVCFCISYSPLIAAPSEINYQGVLTDQQGNPVNGVRTMQIKLYDAPTGGNMTYQQNIGNVTVADGIYSFKFGASGNGIASALNGNDHLALVVDSLEQPTRTKILAVPYALFAKELDNASKETITATLRSELTSVYSLLAAIMSGGLSKSQAQWTGNSQAEIFDASNGQFDSMISCTSSQVSAGVELNKSVILSKLDHVAGFPNPSTYDVNDKIRYIDLSAGGRPGGFTVSYEFSYSDGTKETVSDTQWYYGFRISNPRPEKTVSTLKRTASSSYFGVYIDFLESYRSLSPVEFTIALNESISSGSTLFAGYGITTTGGGVSSVTYELLNNQTVVSSSTTGYLSALGNIGSLALRIRLFPEITNTKNETSIITGASILRVP
jgi:hypothetical protein